QRATLRQTLHCIRTIGEIRGLREETSEGLLSTRVILIDFILEPWTAKFTLHRMPARHGNCFTTLGARSCSSITSLSTRVTLALSMWARTVIKSPVASSNPLTAETLFVKALN